MKGGLRPLVALALLAAAGLTASAGGGGQKQTALKLSAVEKQILDLTNQARKKADLQPLRPNKILFQVARAHSANMAKQRKLQHDLDNKTPFQRIKEAGYRYSRAGENIAGGSPEFGARAIFEGWMKSKAHRDNILNPEYTEIGIARATDASGETYFTQVFGKPRKSAP
jgi:uncharacterized protein YkwD